MSKHFVLHHTGATGEARYAERFLDDIQAEIDRAADGNDAHTDPIRGRLVRSTPHLFDVLPADETSVDPAVLDCVALISLNTDDYLSDQRRMRERLLFRERLRWHQQFTGRISTAHVGVRWLTDPGGPEPTPADALVDGDYGPAYGAAGALRLLRTAPASAEYQRLVARIAGLVRAAALDPVPVMRPEDVHYILGSPPPAHRLGGGQPSDGAAPLGPPARPVRPGAGTGRGRAAIILAVPPADELPPERGDRRYYGSTAQRWRPFLPHAAVSAADVVRVTLEDLAIYDTVCHGLTDQPFATLAAEIGEDRVVIVLVDPWIAATGQADEAMRGLAEWRRRRGTAVGVSLITGRDDPETQAAAPRLTTRLRHLLKEDRGLFRSRTWLPAISDAGLLASSVRPLVVRARHGLLAESRRVALMSGEPIASSGPGRSAGGISSWSRPYHRMWMSNAADVTRQASHRSLGAGVEPA
ncbi:FxsC protein [Parafrankia discariae]|uniref:FxsC protein n=1 Tax=Parafrankia discariae TaxID=365528 RepID=UPI0003998153|nr:FxsC protein [Parafrankia discariae]